MIFETGVRFLDHPLVIQISKSVYLIKLTATLVELSEFLIVKLLTKDPDSAAKLFLR